MSEKTDGLSKELSDVKTDVDGLMSGNTSAVSKLENRLVAMEESTKQQNKKINDLLVLNGDMLERISKVESEQSVLKEHVLTIEKRFNSFEETTSKTFETLKQELQVSNDANLFLDKNMRDLKQVVDYAVNDVRRMNESQQKLNEDTEKRNIEVSASLNRSNEVLNKISDHPPTPDEVAKLCVTFEQRAIETYSTAQYSTITHAMDSNLALTISITANRLATHVANTADMDVIKSKILGPRIAPPASCAPTPNTQGCGNNNHVKKTKYQEISNVSTARQTLGTYNSNANLNTDFNKSSASIRESLLFAFMDELNAIINPGNLKVRLSKYS